MKKELNTENARAFNQSLKNAISEMTNQKVKVSIINSYKFPDCYVQVYADKGFSNEHRMMVFDAFGNKRENLRNVNDVSYGNIQTTHISGKVHQWQNLFN